MILRLRFWKRLVITAVIVTYLGLLLFAFFNRCSRCVITMPAPFSLGAMSANTRGKNRDSVCVVDISTLGLVDITFKENVAFCEIEKDNPAVKEGGTWKPASCQSLQKVAIIIPYRDREAHLKILLHRLHPMLQKQQIEYRIFVVEQFGNDTFNKGTLMNIGFKKAMSVDKFDCLIFHDVDMIAEHDQNFYLCDQHVRHLSPAVDEMRYHVMYFNLLGGAIAITPENFLRVNGYSNSYWGWGNEDDDMSVRTAEVGLLLTRPPDHIGRYKMVPHSKTNRASSGYSLFFSSRYRWLQDGLNDKAAINHTVASWVNHKLYTKIVVNIRSSKGHMLNPAHEKSEGYWWFLKFYFP